MTLSRIAAVALAFAAFVMPTTAFAQPPDMHASTAIAAQQRQQQQQRQDLRSPDARDAARQQRQDLRSPDARDAARSPGHPSEVAPVPAAQPAHGGSGVDWTPIIIAAGIALLAIGGVGALATRRTRVPV
jgi:hypothetical protein